MKKYGFIYLFLIPLCLGVYSCQKKEDVKALPIDLEAQTPFDLWLNSEFTEKYNMEVIYRWDDATSVISSVLIPTNEDKARIAMTMLRDVWIKSYVDVTSENFFKKYCPKQFRLVGGLKNANAISTSGAATYDGESEAGVSITLYGISVLDLADRDTVETNILYTVQRGFAQIFYQKVDISSDFQDISAGKYSASNTGVASSTAQADGFVTAYAYRDYHEDFAETVATFLLKTPAEWTAFVSGIGGDGATAIEKKLTYAKQYFSSTWNVDLDALQSAMNKNADDYFN